MNDLFGPCPHPLPLSFQLMMSGVQLLCVLHQPDMPGTAHLKQGQGRQMDCAAACVHGQRALHTQDLQEGISSSQKKRKNDFTCPTSLQPLMSLWVLTAALQQYQSIPECAWWSASQISSSKNLLYVILISVFKPSFCCQTRITSFSSFQRLPWIERRIFQPCNYMCEYVVWRHGNMPGSGDRELTETCSMLNREHK